IDKNGNKLQETSTDLKGFYQFKNLPEGDYTVVIQKPNTHQFTVQNAAGVSKDVNSDVTPEGKITNIHVNVNNDTPHNDAGLIRPVTPKPLGSLSGHVWIDENKDGKYETTEVLVPNVPVTLFDKAGNLIQTTVTDAKGFYQFKNLPEGDYHVTIEKVDTYQFTTQNATGVSKEVNSDVEVTTGKITNIHVDADKETPYNDAGLVKQDTPQLLGSLSGHVWIDENKDGKYDDTEFLVPNVPVVLFDKNGNVIETTTTDAKGFYQFKNLSTGDYNVVIQKPTGYQFTVQNAAGVSKEVNSDVEISSGKITNIHVVAGQDTPNNDGGLLKDTEPVQPIKPTTPTQPKTDGNEMEVLPDTGNNGQSYLGYGYLAALGLIISRVKKKFFE
ncbi:MAG: SdrD B-like domain-containing protein, partial [Culicoidibacterales bacterium]